MTLAGMKDDDFLISLGAKLRQVRKDKGLSQVEVCSKLKMDKTYLSAIENGHQNLSILTLKQILEAMDVDPKELVDFD